MMLCCYDLVQWSRCMGDVHVGKGKFVTAVFSENGSNIVCMFLTQIVVSLIRFMEGLKTLGVLDCMVQHPDSMKRAFVHSSQKLDATIVEGVFVIPPLSEMGSNRYRMEKTTIAFWRDYLQDLEGSCNLNQLHMYCISCIQVMLNVCISSSTTLYNAPDVISLIHCTLLTPPPGGYSEVL